MASFIHPNAIVEDGAKIGEDVNIGPFAYISSGATIKNNVEVMQGARIEGNTLLEDGVRVYPYAIVGSVPQDISYKGEPTFVCIGSNTVIREFVTINGGTSKGDGYTHVGSNSLIMNYVHIAHDCRVGNNVILANNATLAGHVEIGDYTVVGGMTPIHQFVCVGEGAMIAGASALSQDVPPYCLAEGNRANIKSLNVVGIKRRLSREDSKALHDAFKMIFRTKLSFKDQAKNLLESSNHHMVQSMCKFIINSKRGIAFERVVEL